MNVSCQLTNCPIHPEKVDNWDPGLERVDSWDPGPIVRGPIRQETYQMMLTQIEQMMQTTQLVIPLLKTSRLTVEKEGEFGEM